MKGNALIVDACECTQLHVSPKSPRLEISDALRATGTDRIATDGSALFPTDALRIRAQVVAYTARTGWLIVDDNIVHAPTSRQERAR